ncbi:DUF389 domain-containing protein [Haoranjiania flava]|uniref:DUF389 domain-containing protein n=1 Tax=Haoranjiania flava TaxID=1856322 RepID=A0AAE3LJM0_9BACT|nr:DUF389 domain-containing protein [Haoranjiania flava]MCU7693897.1 DUF389 domain-containing protein [Haoranjiania flava]
MPNFISNTRFGLISRYIRRQVLLFREEADEITHHEIVENAQYRGYNLWILAFSMVLASIGLITNSVAAIIGAMIISPLMGPIFAFAYALAIRDVSLKRKSIFNWIVMVFVSLLSSSIFFLINPFGKSTPLLNAFTQASFFDIMLAFFGGMAGFIGLIKKEGTKIIAGVAVATACMPPLCTAAYGIAHADLSYFAGGMYFFLINCVFIGWGTYFLARLIYHGKRVKNEKLLANYKVWLWNIFTVLMLAPALWISYNKWHAQYDTSLETMGEINNERIIKLENKINQMDAVIHRLQKQSNGKR